jgi:putative membrane protein
LLGAYEKRSADGTLLQIEVKIMHWRIVERGMEFGWLFIVIFTIFMVLGLIHLVNLVSGSRGREPHGESPLHILKRRYAKGEITREEFEKMKDEIAGKIC